jgi:Flp pilus assembly protein TadB
MRRHDFESLEESFQSVSRIARVSLPGVKEALDDTHMEKLIEHAQWRVRSSQVTLTKDWLAILSCLAVMAGLILLTPAEIVHWRTLLAVFLFAGAYALDMRRRKRLELFAEAQAHVEALRWARTEARRAELRASFEQR